MSTKKKTGKAKKYSYLTVTLPRRIYFLLLGLCIENEKTLEEMCITALENEMAAEKKKQDCTWADAQAAKKERKHG